MLGTEKFRHKKTKNACLNHAVSPEGPELLPRRVIRMLVIMYYSLPWELKHGDAASTLEHCGCWPWWWGSSSYCLVKNGAWKRLTDDPYLACKVVSLCVCQIWLAY